MERQITVPLETQLNGMPGLDHIRSISLFGLTDIKCYFQYETDYNFDRQEVLQPAADGGPAGRRAAGTVADVRGRRDLSLSIDRQKQQPHGSEGGADWILERQFNKCPE